MRAARCLNKGQPEAGLFSTATHTMPPLAEFSFVRVKARSRRGTCWNSMHAVRSFPVGDVRGRTLTKNARPYPPDPIRRAVWSTALQNVTARDFRDTWGAAAALVTGGSCSARTALPSDE